jgi:TPR repeat protein
VPTEEGVPLLGALVDGDPEKIREHVAAARALPNRIERGIKLYFLGCGLLACREDDAQEDGLRILLEAAGCGSPDAACEVAVHLIRRSEDEDEVDAAVALLEVAASAGHVNAKAIVGRLYLGDSERVTVALTLLQEAFEAGSPDAAYSLGLAAFRGVGAAKDHHKARRLYEYAADSGHAEALFELSQLHEWGYGGPVDEQLAAQLVKAAAAAGSARAHLKLGAESVWAKEPPAKAVEHFEIAAQLGSEEARRRLEHIRRLVEDDPSDEP